MKLNQYDIFYFLGIGGIGMSALARYFHSQGKQVMGYDKTSTPLTTELEMEGIAVHFEDSVLEIAQLVKLSEKEKVLVVLTPAIPKDSNELLWFQQNNYTILKRSQVLGLITETSKTIAVAGTHGKTTTSALIAHILTSSGHGCNAFLGGITANYNTNLLLSPGVEWTVVEADEYDRSFLTLSPTIAVITSMDADHLDIYGTHDYMIESYNLFANRVVDDGVLIVRKDLPLAIQDSRFRISNYSITESADYMSEDIRIENGEYVFGLRGIRNNLKLGLAGRHNVENAIAACAVCLEIGIEPEKIREALASFLGVKRRFEYIIKRPNLVLIDDYAHHPEELRACISSARELYPGKKLTGIFQPHLFTRTRDFADDFARSLELLDEIILLPIYPARELPLPGIDSQMLLDKIRKPHKMLVEKSGLLAELGSREVEVVLMLGAGDIDAWVQPVHQLMKTDDRRPKTGDR
ncbi:MAG: UDP-N-acetylmuramate--L-alanine ligase [Flavobacteriales bacterium]|nr:UDP-N-acetylmuramate--L-alanine ligase [Flavobacteriales bacterium]